MKRVVKIASIAALIVVALAGLWVYSVVKRIRFVDQVVAEKIPVAGEWVAVTPPGPLNAAGRSRYLSIAVEGASKQPNRLGTPGTQKSRPGDVRLADGTVVVPEIQVIDEGGGVYNLSANFEDYAGVAYSPSPDAGAGFTRAGAIKLIRVRSEAPILISKMTWHYRAEARP
jgi:hypothetical protein